MLTKRSDLCRASFWNGRQAEGLRIRSRVCTREVHAILNIHLIVSARRYGQRLRPCRLARQPAPDDECFGIDGHVRGRDRLGEDLPVLDREIAETTMDDPVIRRLLTFTGVNLAVAAGLMAAIGISNSQLDFLRTALTWLKILGEN
jgi:transposase